MDILGVTQKSHEGGIELADLDSVKEALRLFATGSTPAAGATMQHGFDNGPAGGFAIALKTVLEGRHESSFMQDLLSGVNRVTEDRGFHRSYDYDGIGPFFKTTVEVEKVKVGRRKFVFLLKLNAAYVGDKPCGGLATVLGANRALWRDEVDIDLAPVGDHFEIDFDIVAERLARIGFIEWTGSQIADFIMAEAPKGYDAKSSIEICKDDLSVTFGISSYSVEGPVDRQSREVVWTQSGSVISGPLQRGYDGEKYSKPQLYASISVPSKEGDRSWDRKPVIDPMIKQAIHDQASAIVGAFQ